jgi:hypothetical protein
MDWGDSLSETPELQPKHWKALELWEEGMLSLKDISKACSIPTQSMYDLFEGNSQQAGAVAHLFKSEVDKITSRTSARVKSLVKDNQKQAHILVNERLKDLKKLKKVDHTTSLELTKILGVLNKATPSIEIGSMSFTKGMTAEELKGEFGRLTALAEQAVKSGGIRGLSPTEPGGIPGASAGGDRLPEE